MHIICTNQRQSIILNKKGIKDKIVWLQDNLELIGVFHNNELINLKLPATMELKVIETEPGFKGDTVKLVTKPAKLETGAIIQVPVFIKAGDKIKIDTNTKKYLGRV